MAITSADAWFAAARQLTFIRKTQSVAIASGVLGSLLDVAGTPGNGSLAIGNTTTGLVPTDAGLGYPDIKAFGGGAKGYLGAAQYRGSVAGGAILYDRLWHAGSISMTSLATTTFSSQPSFTSRIPDGTDYSDLEILLEINAAVSNTATTIAVGYTKEDGTTGRSTGATAGLNSFATRRVLPLPLQAGDKGVQRIDSLTVGGTVATTGSVNVIVARRLAEFDVRVPNGLDSQAWDLLGAPEIFADSALWMVGIPDSTVSGLPSLGLTILNG